MTLSDTTAVTKEIIVHASQELRSASGSTLYSLYCDSTAHPQVQNVRVEPKGREGDEDHKKHSPPVTSEANTLSIVKSTVHCSPAILKIKLRLQNVTLC